VFRKLTYLSPSSKVRTPDMGGNSTTHEFTKAILNKMENSL
jgi:isocitrate dehydrogenase (NAD+)